MPFVQGLYGLLFQWKESLNVTAEPSFLHHFALLSMKLQVATLEVLEFPELGMEAVWKIEADHGSMGRFESNPRAPGRPRWKTSLHLYWLMTKVLCYLCCYVWQVHISHLHSWFLFLTPKVMIFSRTGTCEVSSGSDQTRASLAFLFIFLHFRPIFVPRLR